ncbi:MAG: ABC transporter permease [Sulfolobales archaeon]
MVVKLLLQREIKALIKSPGFIISLIILVAFYAGLGKLIGYSVESNISLINEPMGVVINDHSPVALKIIEYLNESLGKRLFIANSLTQGLELYNVVMYIPKNFSENFLRGVAEIVFYQRVSRVGGLSIGIYGSLNSVLEPLKDTYYKISLNNSLTTPNNFTPSIQIFYELDGVRLNSLRYLSVVGFFSTSIMFIAIIFMFSASFSMQFMTSEKTQKAFEMLLAQPIRRRNIVLAKILGGIIASLIEGVVFAIGLLLMFYFSLPISKVPGSLDSDVNRLIYGASQSSNPSYFAQYFIETMNPAMIITIIVLFILGLVFTSAIGVIVGMLVSDEKVAGMLIGPLIFSFIGIGMAVMFVGLPIDPMTAFVSSIGIAPAFVYVIIGFLINRIDLVLLPIASLSIIATILMLLSFYLIERDVVILGIRLTKKIITRD